MKKIIALVLVLVLALTAIGGTLAYFTDTEGATNAFVIGHVDIELEEKFDENNLVPGVDLEKNAWITLKAGSEPAYVWAEWLIPAVLDSTDGSTGTNNIVHINTKGAYWDKYYTQQKYIESAGLSAAVDYKQTWDLDANEELPDLIGTQGFVGTETIDGVVYNKYVALYHGVLTAGESTTPFMDKVYLDTKVDCDHDADGIVDGTYSIVVNGVATPIDYDFSKGVDIPVSVYGIQSEGLTDADKDGDIDVYDAYMLYAKQWN